MKTTGGGILNKVNCVQIRKCFDKEVQKVKRVYWFELEKKLLSDCNVGQAQFWTSVEKIGVGFSKKKTSL